MWLVIIITILALAALYRFDRFNFLASSGNAKVEIRGDFKENRSHSLDQGLAAPSAIATSSSQFNKTEGDQSPVQNNVGSRTVIKYETR